MTVGRTYFGVYYDFGVDKELHQALVTVAIPLSDGGPALAELTAWYEGIKQAPVAVTMLIGPAASVLRRCLDPASLTESEG